ncbi:hypothetical protein I3842_06G145800 [Carya illinoinensis]|uniref:Cysteine-rich PDZ-binding protein n=1 Tax=Carya illinoinensis TaxID=32201 RepID=A0A922JJD0_CARIL|nr:hypothetical protein I3842_06G145800 [Carya illinoinensis]
MVCEKCEKKLSKVIVLNKWKEGASNTTEGGGCKINENKLFSKKKKKKTGFNPEPGIWVLQNPSSSGFRPKFDPG